MTHTTRSRLKHNSNAGFTLVELVLVVVLLGILSAVAAPRFFERSAFQDRAVYDDIASQLRFAQKMAVATGCPIQFQFLPADNRYQVMRQEACNNGDFDTAVNNPSTNTALANTLNGTPFNTSHNTITFFALGNASAAANLVVAGRTINVEMATGFINAQ